jgi:hypothetical protein
VAAITVTSIGEITALGSPRYWPWILTGIQVIALFGASTGRPVGWLLGSAVQLPWVAYALLTSQLGFVPGCLVSAVVQANGYLRRRSSPPVLSSATYA